MQAKPSHIPLIVPILTRLTQNPIHILLTVIGKENYKASSN